MCIAYLLLFTVLFFKYGRIKVCTCVNTREVDNICRKELKRNPNGILSIDN